MLNYTWSAIGLGTKFATIVVEKLEPGGVYNITKLRNLPLRVINSGDAETDAGVEIEIPSQGELKEGYEPIPDPSWIRIIPERFHLKPGEEIACDVIISIPNDLSLIGKHFQAKIWAHTTGEDMFGAGVVNRIFFSIGEGPEAVRKAKRKELLYTINFDVSPEMIYLTVPIGKKIDLLKQLDKTVKLINKGKQNVTVKLTSVKKPETFLVSPEYEFTPNPEFIKIKPEKVEVKTGRIKDARIFIEIPDEEKYKAKKYMFLIKTTIIKPDVPIEFHTKIMVTTQ